MIPERCSRMPASAAPARMPASAAPSTDANLRGSHMPATLRQIGCTARLTRTDDDRVDKPAARTRHGGPIGRSLRRRRRDLRPVLERRRGGRGVPVRRVRPGDAVRPRAGGRVRLAGPPARRRARPAVRLPGRTDPGIRRRAPAATRPSCYWTRTAAPSRARWNGTRRCSGTLPTTPTGPTRTTRRHTFPARCWWPPRASTGARIDRRAGRWRTRSSTRFTSRGSPSSIPACPRRCAAPTRGWPTRRRCRTSSGSASPRWSCSRSISSSTTPSSSPVDCATTGATSRSATSRRTTSTPQAARSAAKSTSSAGWSARCTRPESR